VGDLTQRRALRSGFVTYRIELTGEAERHLAALSARDRRSVVRALEEKLLHQPAREARNRKRMRANPVAPWVLRVGHLRVYYDVTKGEDRVVTVRAIGVKNRNRLMIAGEEIDLS
jgi:mRNA-degrading endonuclease RelE of RelBE toxin-antitoxin system